MGLETCRAELRISQNRSHYGGISVSGAAYGILMNVNGYGIGWTAAISIFVYAGSLQYLGVTMLAAAVYPVTALVMSLMLNARHLFYGISMLGKYGGLKRFRAYLIFSLTDETFSVVCSEQIPSELEREWVYFWISFLNQCYWRGRKCSWRSGRKPDYI